MTTDKSTPVPRLRFPEFQNAGDWITKILDNQGGFLSSLTGKTAKDFDMGDATFIPYMNVFSNTFTNIFDLRSVNVDSDESQNAIAKGDVFFTVSSEIPEEAGMSSVLLEEIENCYLNSFCTLFRFDRGKSPNPVFLGYLLRSALARAHLSRGAQGATRYNIPKETFRSLPLQLPSCSEQRKIADCIGSLDDLIAAEGRKLEALRQHKQGLMQKLLPQPGETVPRLRFPQFRDAGEWEEKRLGDLGTLISGLTYNPKDVRDGGLLVLRSSNIQNGEIVLDDCVYVRRDMNGANLTQSDDILICVRNGSRALIGKNAIVPKGMPVCTHGAFMTVFRASAPHFARVLLQTTAYQKQVTADLGATINSINRSQLLKYRFTVPKAAEQQRIAACLSAVDTQIAAQARRIASLKQHKQGLQQQLFPSLAGQ